MFVDLDWPLNASSLLSASAELLVRYVRACVRVCVCVCVKFSCNAPKNYIFIRQRIKQSHFTVSIEETSLGQLPKVDLIILEGEKCPYVRMSIRPSTKSFFDLNEIWYIGRGRWVMHDGMPYGRIQGQARFKVKPLKVWIPSIFKTYLLRHLQWELASDH